MALRLTQEGSNSPRRDTGHSFQPKDHMETRNGSEYPNPALHKSINVIVKFSFCFFQGGETLNGDKNVAKIISLTYNLDRC